VQSRVSRVARGWIAGAFATGVAAVSHGLAAGSAPSSLAIVVGLVFAGMLGTLVIGRAPSLPRLALVVAGSQVAFHVVFSWLTPGTVISAPTPHHGVATVLSPMVEPAVAHHGTDPWMWAAHGVALLATVVFLRRAELALWTLLRDALRAIIVPTVAIEARPATVPTIPPDAPRHPVSFSFLSVVCRRGPPALGFTL
jgi:hypothetical protein